MPTKQITFNTVIRHLRTQRCRALVQNLDPNTRKAYPRACVYRTKSGKKCAAGCLIPDELYKPEMESQGLYKGSPVTLVLNRLRHNISLVCDLQDLHDNYEPQYWEKQAQIVAAAHHIRYTPPRKKKVST